MREKRSQSQNILSNHHKAEEKAEFLARSSIFQHLNPEGMRELNRITTLITCSPGRIFYRPGESGSLLFLLMTGRVQLYHLSTDGRKLITATLEPGACFGEAVFLAHGSYTSFAEATEASRVCLINKQDADELLTHTPSIALALLNIVGERFRYLESQLLATTFKSATARLAALLLHLAQAQDKNLLVVKGLSQEELAEHLGIYRETVSASLRELKEAGVIEPARKQILIRSPEQLSQIAASENKNR